MFRRVLARAATRHAFAFFLMPFAAIVFSIRLGHLTGVALATVILHPVLTMLAVLRADHGERLPSFVDATRDFIRTDRISPRLYWGTIGFPLASLAFTLNHWFPPPFTSDARLLIAFADAVFLPIAGLSSFALFLKMRAAHAVEA